MIADQKYCVIVDGYSSGNLLAPVFRGRGVKCIHVLSSRANEKIMQPSFVTDDFNGFLVHEGDLAALTRAVAQYKPVCVIPGTETGVELADILSEKLALAMNGTKASHARRNKYDMAERVAAAGLPVARQEKVYGVEMAAEWYRHSGLKKVVVKPLNSAGTDGFKVCESAEEVGRAVGAILRKKNKLGLVNEQVLMQEFLAGTEYFANTVSRDGKHRFVEIWRYQKRSINGHDSVYDSSILCEYDEPVSVQLRAYVAGVLNALEITHGPAHTEIMMTAGGPRLIETGARLDGLCVPALSRATIGDDQADLTAQAYLGPAAFLEKIDQGYPILKHGMNVHLAVFEAGMVKSTAPTEAAKQLESFFQMRLRAKPGAEIQKTIDWFTTVGFVSLAHANINNLMADYDTLRAAEKKGFIEFERSPHGSLPDARN